MEKIRKILIAIAVLFILFIPLWLLIITPAFENLISESDEEFNLIGINRLVAKQGDDINAVMPKAINEQITSSYRRIDGQVNVDEHIADTDIASGEIFWQSSKSYLINPKTGSAESNEFSGSIFKPHLSPKDYDKLVFISFQGPLELNYQGKENLNGIDVYRFSWLKKNIDTSGNYLSINVPKSYQNTPGFLWVEPLSGYVVGFGYGWEVFTEQNSNGAQIEKGEVKSSIDSIDRRVLIAHYKKQELIIINYIVPVFFALVASALLIAGNLAKMPMEGKK